MKPKRVLYSVVLAALCAVMLRGQVVAKRPSSKPPTGASPSGSNATANSFPPFTESDPIGREVYYGEKDVVKLNAKLRYTTLIVLPKNEKILDFTCGDKEFWVVNGAENMAYVKPAKEGAQTNLNLITASGNIYSFVLTEVSETPNVAPDLKVFIALKDESMVAAANTRPRFVSALDVDDFRQQAELAREETRRVKQAEQSQIDHGINSFLSTMRFSYQFKAGRKPFYVRAIYHDDKFTYIQARPQEMPVLYEVEDGKPNLINFEYANGVFVVHKIVDRGYLAIGKAKLHFYRKD